MNKARWRVFVSFGGNGVYIEAEKGLLCCRPECGDGVIIVDPPNWVERLFGVTFESKIKKGIARCQRWCDKQNAKEATIVQALQEFTKADVAQSKVHTRPESTTKAPTSRPIFENRGGFIESPPPVADVEKPEPTPAPPPKREPPSPLPLRKGVPNIPKLPPPPQKKAPGYSGA